MRKEDIDDFIKIMKEIREDWTPEQVEETYGDVTLREALNIRLNKMRTFYDFVEEVVVPDLEQMRAAGVATADPDAVRRHLEESKKHMEIFQ